MCTASTYKTKDFYMGRTFDYEFSYGEEIVVTPKNMYSISGIMISYNSLCHDRDGIRSRWISALLRCSQ